MRDRWIERRKLVIIYTSHMATAHLVQWSDSGKERTPYHTYIRRFGQRQRDGRERTRTNWIKIDKRCGLCVVVVGLYPTIRPPVHHNSVCRLYNTKVDRPKKWAPKIDLTHIAGRGGCWQQGELICVIVRGRSFLGKPWSTCCCWCLMT